MNTTPVINVEKLAKYYRLGAVARKGTADYETLGETLTAGVRSIFRKIKRTASGEGSEKVPVNDLWALRDVSFQVNQGEVIGLIGRNGAGKSTLLKILSRITEPTHGFADIRGRVGSLLEVGTGFHPELTGRDNIFLNGAILGMKKREISQKFDEMIAFAEMEKFIDTPVKHYSSGMYLRLAFAVAAHLEPEILLVDEVLAVGDAAFQKKCLGKMSGVAKEGRTVLFVSHNMAAVRNLCQRCILLENGRVAMDGPAGPVIERYLKGGAQSATEIVYHDLAKAPGNEKVRITAVRILDEDGRRVEGDVDIESPLMVEVEYRTSAPGMVLNLSLSVFNQDDVYILASPSISDQSWFQRPHPVGTYRSRCILPASLFNTGRYAMSALLVENGRNVVATAERAVSVDLIDLGKSRGGYFGYWGGVVRPQLQWATEHLETEASPAAVRP